MSEIISSKKNSAIKYLRKLYRARNRRKEGKFLLEGSRIVQHAVKKEMLISRVFVSADFDDQSLIKKLKQSDCQLITISRELLDEIADTVSPQGIIAIADKPNYQLSDIWNNSQDSLLLLDRIQDPGNMGALIRTAAAAGVKGIIALKGCVDIYNLKVLRATMGAIFNIPICTRIDVTKIRKKAKELEHQIVCADLSGPKFHYEINFSKKTIFVIGNEAQGISQEILSLSDQIVKIPLNGAIESLNAAVSGGIILYEYLRQQKN